MSSFPCAINLTEEVLSFRNDAFYNLVKQQCGDTVLEIMQAQDISSVDCLLDIDDVFSFLELNSDELIPLKTKSGILLSNGRFVIKQGIIHKVEVFLRTLHTFNRQHSTSFHHNSNNSCDLIVPEHLLQRFPFTSTLIIYSNLILKSKIDFTFFNIIMNNIFMNLITEERGYRYDTIVQQFASSLYTLGGHTAYEFVRLNIPAFLPSVKIIQSYIAASVSHVSEGLCNYNGLCDYFSLNQSTLGFFAEDSTAVVPKITYDTSSNTFIGFFLPLDNTGLPIINSYSTDSLTRLEYWYSNVPKTQSLNACLIQPLSCSFDNSSPYLLTAYGTDNRFKSSDVISRWRHIYHERKFKGIRTIGYATDTDSRYLNVMRLSLGFFADFVYSNHPDVFEIHVPATWSWFLMQHKQLFVCMQDSVHICAKLSNRLLSKTTTLLLGNQFINVEPLLYIVDNFSKIDHALVRSDINSRDRQNYRSCEKISSDNVLALLEKVPNSVGINIYLQV